MQKTTKMKLKQIASIVLFLTLIVALAFYLYENRNDFKELFKLDTSLIGWILFFAFCGCMMNALYHKWLLDTYKLPLTLSDWVGVVSIANVIAYVAPLRMDLLFSAAYYRKTKGLAYVKSASMAAGNIVFGVAFSLIQMVVALLCTGLINGNWPITLWLVCGIIFIGLAAIIACSLLFDSHKPPFLRNVKILWKIVGGFNELLRNRKLLVQILVCLTFNNLFQLLLYMTCFQAIGIETALYDALFYSAVSRMITFVAIVPGNIGIKEMVMGIATSLMGTLFANGVAVSLLHRVALMCIHFGLAIIFVYPVFKRYNQVEANKE